jgi:hypothetical protein
MVYQLCRGDPHEIAGVLYQGAGVHACWFWLLGKLYRLLTPPLETHDRDIDFVAAISNSLRAWYPVFPQF